MLLRLVKQCHSVWQEILHVFKSYNQCTALLQQAVAQWQSMCLQITSKRVRFTPGSMLSNMRNQIFPTLFFDLTHTFSFDLYIHLHLYYVNQWKDIFILITWCFCMLVRLHRKVVLHQGLYGGKSSTESERQHQTDSYLFLQKVKLFEVSLSSIISQSALFFGI